MTSKTLQKSLVAATLLLSVLNFLMYWIRIREIRPQSQLVNRILVEPVEPKIQVPEAVLRLNEANKQINNFSCREMRVKAWENGSRYRLSGELHFEKPLNFRMKINSFFGREIDLGANDSLFWYWSKRDPHPGLYYAYYKDYQSTRLKTPFNPVFLRSSLGLNELDLEKAKFIDQEEMVLVVYPSKNALGIEVLHTIFVEKTNPRVAGHLITDLDAKPLASAEILEFEGRLPKKILYTWHEEDRALLLEFEEIRWNNLISGSEWQMPNRQPLINMAEE